MKVTRELSAKDVMDIIKKHFSKYGKITRCEVLLDEECQGYGMDEHTETVFNGIRVTIEE